jgi:hypothetical protein
LNKEVAKPKLPIKPDLKAQKLSLAEDISSAKIKALYFKSEGNKRARDSWNRVVDCLESKLLELKGK